VIDLKTLLLPETTGELLITPQQLVGRSPWSRDLSQWNHQTIC
jgi:hypothetical protein